MLLYTVCRYLLTEIASNMSQLTEHFARLKIAYPTPSNEPRSEILIKFEYASEKRAFYVKWPIRYDEIERFVNDKFGPNLSIVWIQGKSKCSLASQAEIDNLISRMSPEELTSAPSIILTPRMPDTLEVSHSIKPHSPRHSMPIIPSQSQFNDPIYVTCPNEVRRSNTDEYTRTKLSFTGFSTPANLNNPFKVQGQFIPDTDPTPTPQLRGFTPTTEGDTGGRFVPENIAARDSGGSFGSDSTTNSSGLSEQELDKEIASFSLAPGKGILPISVTRSDEASFIPASKPILGVPNHWTKGVFLGSGGFGSVFTAKCNQTGRELAVKQIPISEDSINKEEVQSFEREIQALQTLNNPRVITYFGIEKTDACISIFMEYMPGGSLHAYIKRVGSLSEKKTLRFSVQILEGIHYLHSKSIVHRDIKGANVLMSGNDVKLGDFGASKRLGTLLSSFGKHTNIKSIHGTSYWMAPEVIKGEGYGRRADIWSLGCTIVEMLTMSPPWFKLEPMAAMFKIASEKTDPALPREISQDCRTFVHKCLTRDKTARPYANELLYHPFVAKEINYNQQLLIH